jgi:GT2 family glycosyltransferase
MEITLCIPTLKRYDLLTLAIDSASKGNVKPDHYVVFDNGGALDPLYLPDVNVFIYSVYGNMGVAAAWNYFLKNIPEIRIIVNDDVIFFDDTIERLIEAYDEDFLIYPDGAPSANSFSCFILPDKVVNEVGYFDEKLSPGYAYFEDNDYHRRMKSHGYDIKGVPDCRIKHEGSATLDSYTLFEMERHHERFRLAQRNYVAKWGGLPGKERFTIPYNRE